MQSGTRETNSRCVTLMHLAPFKKKKKKLVHVFSSKKIWATTILKQINQVQQPMCHLP